MDPHRGIDFSTFGIVEKIILSYIEIIVEKCRKVKVNLENFWSFTHII